MRAFNGFPPGKTYTTTIPNLFFSELLQTIDDLVELKLILYCFWVLQQQEGEYRYLVGREVLHDELFLGGVDADPDVAGQKVKAALERTVARGTLLHVTVDGTNGPEALYFMNTVRGRNAVRAIEAGQYEVGGRDCPIALIIERPNVFTLYEQNIGPLTPLIGDQLRQAEQDYPVAWIEEAIQLAVEHNKRNWRYVLAILKRWHTEGKDRGLAKQPTKADRYRYIKGELSDIIDY
ncbi:MAG: DnaD domain protein [Anaerolineae bacterium]|jgi:DNA replication protein|nr:DnaD domain protein [Anaerolineae bacterium]